MARRRSAGRPATAWSLIFMVLLSMGANMLEARPLDLPAADSAAAVVPTAAVGAMPMTVALPSSTEPLTRAQKATRVLGALIGQVPQAFARIAPASGTIKKASATSASAPVVPGGIDALSIITATAPTAATPASASPAPISPAEAAAGAALWSSQASSWDKATMTPFRGPPQLLKRFTPDSPEVKALLAATNAQAQRNLAAARRRFHRAAVARRTVRLAQAAAASGVSTGHIRLPRPAIMTKSASLANAANATNATFVNGTTASNTTNANMTVTGISAEFAWDGDVMFGADLTLSGPNISADNQQLAKDILREAFNTAVPELKWEELPLANTPLMDLAAAYDRENRTLAFNASSGNYLWLLNGIADQAKATFGVTLPTYDASSTTATTAVSLLVDPTGLQQLSVGLGGSWTAGTLANTLGVSWPLDDGLFSVSTPSIVYTGLPLSLGITMGVDVPELNIANATTSLNVQPGNSLQLQMFGNFQPFPALTLNGFDLSVVKGVGLQGTGLGSIGSTPFNVTTSLSGNKTSRAVKMTLTAANVGVSDVLNGVFQSDNLVPDFITNFCAPLSFKDVTLTYDSTAPAKKKFGIKAVPDIDKATALQSVFKTVGLDPADLALTVGPNQVQLGLSKAYSLDLPSPFTGPANVSFNLGADAMTKEFALGGAFSASLTGKGLAAPVGIAASASIGLASGEGVNVGLSGATTTPIVIDKFPWLTFGALSVSGSVTPAAPPVLNRLEMAGSLNVLGANASAALFFDKASASMAMSAALDNLDIQKMLNAAGVDANLGILNLQMTDVAMSYATVPVPTMSIPQGMYYRGSLGFLGMRSTTAFALNEDGVDFSTLFNATEANKALNAAVLAKVDGALQAAGDAMNAAGSDLQKAKADAQANLNKALADLEAAKGKVADSLKAFDDAKATANAGVADAQKKVDAAQAAFDAANNKAQSDLAKAKQAFAVADQAFQTAINKANSDLNAANSNLQQARQRYQNVVNDAYSRLNAAQANANSLWDTYNYYNSRCDGWPRNWGNCAAAGGAWTAYQTAKGVLDGARGFVNSVMNGAEKVAMDAAAATLSRAQQAVNGVLSGTQAATRKTALGTLTAAQAVADGVLKGTEFVSLNTARGVLIAAQKVASGVLTGTEFVAWQSAVAGLDFAKDKVKAASAVATATLDTLTAALNAVGDATKQIRTAGFLQLNALGLRLKTSKTSVAVGVSYELSVASQPIKGAADLDVNNPLDAIVNFMKGPAITQLQKQYPALAPFLKF